MILEPSDFEKKELYSLLLSVIVPRPIAWISTIGESGIPNLAPFSFFVALCSSPPLLGVSISRRKGKKDTLRNLERTGDFVVNLVDEDMKEKMNVSSGDYPEDVSEFKLTGLTPASSLVVSSPRVLESPVNMECKVVKIIELGNEDSLNSFVIGEIVKFHIREGLFDGEKVDVRKLRIIGRLSQDMYCHVNDIFEMKRPKIDSVL